MNKSSQFDPQGIYRYVTNLGIFAFGAIIITSLLFSFSTKLATQAPLTVDAIATTSGQMLEVPKLPVRLHIPAIDVDASIQYVGLDPSGTGEMGVPDNFTDVGWYEPGVRPGAPGSAVIAGHYNGKGIPKAVFFELETLIIGDEVLLVTEDGTIDTFQVIRIERYDFDAPATEVFLSTDGKKRLNLITCSGVWLPEANRFDKRTVVFTELQSDKD